MNESINCRVRWDHEEELKMYMLFKHSSSRTSHCLILSWPLLQYIKHKGFVRREFCSSSLRAKPTIVKSVSTQHTIGLQAAQEPPRCNLKLVPILGGQGGTKGRGGLC